MSFISVFDVLGPNIDRSVQFAQRPALRQSPFLQERCRTPPLKKLILILYGSFARTYKGHGTDRALLGGSWDFQPTTDGFRIHFLSPMSADFSIRLRQIQQKPKFTLTQ